MININTIGTKSLKDFEHMFSKIENHGKGYYFICGNYLKDNIYRDQIYFINTDNEIFYYSCFNEWNRSNNKQEHFTNLYKLV